MAGINTMIGKEPRTRTTGARGQVQGKLVRPLIDLIEAQVVARAMPQLVEIVTTPTNRSRIFGHDAELGIRVQPRNGQVGGSHDSDTVSENVELRVEGTEAPNSRSAFKQCAEHVDIADTVGKIVEVEARDDADTLGTERKKTLECAALDERRDDPKLGPVATKSVFELGTPTLRNETDRHAHLPVIDPEGYGREPGPRARRRCRRNAPCPKTKSHARCEARNAPDEMSARESHDAAGASE